MGELDDSSTSGLASTSVQKQIRQNMMEEIAAGFAVLSDIRIRLLNEACFMEFKKNLSKL